MKNKGLTILFIIILSLVVVSLIVFLCFAIRGKFNIQFNFKLGNKIENIIFDESYEISNITNLEIISDAGNINFKNSQDDKIRIVAYGKNSNDVKVFLTENKLNVDYSNSNKINIGVDNYLYDIIIYIPSNYSNEINIDADYGNIEILDIENSIINIKADCGNINIGTVNTLFIDSDYGNIEIKQILNDFSIKADCGNIEIDSVQIKESSSIKSDYGNIEIKEVNDIYIDSQVDLGEAKINKNNTQSSITLKIEASCGNVEVGN